ncbi:PKD domain-containing protein [Owenweeksia hongkongensis]|uniref:T9SS type A sorting domain-containing protein n=1 Tax=Owenweeksia hongkongensis TaxID=253245 RepID=UPI003A8F1CAF
MNRIILLSVLVIQSSIICFSQSTPDFIKLPDTGLTATFRSWTIKHYMNSFPSGYSYHQSWDFGDGQTAFFQSPETKVLHSYSSPGWYNVSRSYAVVDIHNDTLKSGLEAQSVPVGFIHNTGCNAILVAPDSVLGYSVTLSDSSLNDTFAVPVYNFNLLNGENLSHGFWYSYGPPSTTGPGGLHSNSTYYKKSGLQKSCLYRQFRDTTGALICEAYDCAETFVQPANLAWSSITHVIDTVAKGKVKFSSSYGAASFNSSIHREQFNWSFGDGNRSDIPNPIHYYSEPGVYTVELAYTIVEDISNRVLGVGLSYDTVVIAATNDCNVEFGYKVNIANTSVGFKNHSSCLYPKGGYLEKFEWSFGDGNVSTDKNPTHVYTSQGTYQVSLIQIVEDVQYNVVCTDTLVKTVALQPSTISCNALYEVDTLTSGNGNLNIINLSTPQVSSTGMAVDFVWDFGDGSISRLPFPSHTYTTSGIYELCLTISVTDSLANHCTSTFCDSVGMDTAGNILYKNSAVGFTLNVVDPNAVGVKEAVSQSEISIYPNPASNFVNVEGLTKDAEWTLYNLQGAIVAEGTLQSEESKVNLDVLESGLYIFSIQSMNSAKSIKLSIR